LERGGILCSITHVQTANSFVSALERGGIDLILSDFSVPAYDGATAAELVRTKWPTIPLILISGTLGEELAIDALKSGATDYVLKQRLARLVPAVRRAMKEVETAAEQRKLEAKFVEAQKREAIGQLSSGVAHDFNNILAVIMGYNDLLSTALETDSRLKKYTEEIRDASNRAAALTRQLLVFSRKQFASPTVMDPNQAVKGLEILLRRLMDEKIEIAIVTEQNIGRVKANSQLHRASIAESGTERQRRYARGRQAEGGNKRFHAC
jgi:two-component system, cell cycle sensor histidine kinase and response regulator CckA